MYSDTGQTVHAILMLVLLSVGSASSREHDDEDGEFERRLARFNLEKHHREPFRNHPPYGENEFLLVLAGTHKPFESFPERMNRIKRSFNNLDCAKTVAPFVGKNDFESGNLPANQFLGAFEALGVDIRNQAPAEIAVDRTVPYDAKECLDDGAFQIYEEYERRSRKRKKKLQKRKDPKKTIDKKQNSKAQCGQEKTSESIGISCCLYWAKIKVQICVAVGFIVSSFEFELKITAQDFTLIDFTYQFDQNDFTRAGSYGARLYSENMTILDESLCIPHKLSWSVTGCVQAKLDYIPAPTKGKQKGKAKLILCLGFLAQIMMGIDIALFDLPCWKIPFKIPGKGKRQGELPESPNFTPIEPIQTFYAAEDLDVVEGAVVNLTAKGDREYDELRKNNPDGVIRQDTNEPPRVLKKGKPTFPVNWEVTDISQLHYFVVLYLLPLASPTESHATDHVESKVDAIKNTTQDSLEARKRDPSYVNLRVGAAMGRSCGGIVISPNKILTLCDCVAYFYLYHKYGPEEAKKIEKDVFTLESKHVYVTYASKKFNADQIEYALDTDPRTFMKKSQCIDAIERFRSNKENTAQATYGLAIAMAITRTFPQAGVLKLAPWAGVTGPPISVKMTAIGFRKVKDMDIFDKTGLEFNPLYEVINVPFVSCPKTKFCQQGAGWKDSREFDQETQCFCAIQEGYHLCDGVIGFPVRDSSGEVIGLNSLSMDCKNEGSMVTAVFSADQIKEIEDYVEGVDNAPALSGSLLLITAFFAILQST